MKLYLIRSLIICTGALGLLIGGCSAPDPEKQLAKNEAQRDALMERIALVKNDAVRAELSQMARMVFWMREIGIENSVQPAAAVYADPPLAILDDYASVQKMAGSFVNGVFLEFDPSYPFQAELNLPFEYPFDYEFKWKTASLDNGANVPIEPFDQAKYFQKQRGEKPATDQNAGSQTSDADEAIVVSEVYDNRFQVVMNTPDNAQRPGIKALEASLEVSIPKSIHRVSFFKNDVGKTKTAGDFRVSLHSVDGHQAMVAINHKKGEKISLYDMLKGRLELAARDATGRTLAESGSSTGPPDVEDALIKALTNATDYAIKAGNSDGNKPEENIKKIEAMFEERQDKLVSEYGGAAFYSSSFRGPVETLDVLLIGATGSTTKPFELSLAPLNFEARKNVKPPVAYPTQALVYDHSLNSLFDAEPMELTPGELATGIKVSQRSYSDSIEYYNGKAQVEFIYPELPSNIFTGGFDRFEFTEDIAFYDADDKIIPMPENDAERAELFEASINRIEYFPARFPSKPIRMTGTISVTLRPTIRKQWVDDDSVPEGAILSDNVYVDAPIRNKPRVYAQDPSGQFLKKMGTILHWGDDAPSRTAHYYFGTPTRVLLLHGGNRDTAPYTFNVELASE